MGLTPPGAGPIVSSDVRMATGVTARKKQPPCAIREPQRHEVEWLSGFNPQCAGPSDEPVPIVVHQQRYRRQGPCSSDQQCSLKFQKAFQTTALAKSI
jgi:hypothetical protein